MGFTSPGALALRAGARAARLSRGAGGRSEPRGLLSTASPQNSGTPGLREEAARRTRGRSFGEDQSERWTVGPRCGEARSP